jgi:cysteine desulfurase family protein
VGVVTSAGPRGVYLDNAATSWPKPPGVLQAIQEFFAEAGGNTGRAGHRRSIASSRAVSLARERIADLLGAETPDQLVFTKNATEGLNVAILGLVLPGARVVTSSLEHNSVMRPLRDLEGRGVCTLEVVPVDGNTGKTDLAEWSERLGGTGPRVAVVTHASNVTGVLLPVAPIAQLTAESGVPLIVDASQSAGHVPLVLSDLGAAAVAMPGHKGLLGPTGTGLLYLSVGVEIEPLIRGGTGSQSELEVQPDFAPDRYESGTLNGVGIVGLGAAAEHLLGVGVDAVHRRLSELGARFRAALADVDEIVMNGPADPAAGVGILSLNVAGAPCATVSRFLDDEWGVMTRAGLHCSPAAHRSLGTAPGGTVRFSWSHETTEQEIDVAVEALRTIATRVQPAEPAETVA